MKPTNAGVMPNADGGVLHGPDEDLADQRDQRP